MPADATDFLNSAGVRPSGLVVEGEPGIGKTTRWLAVVGQAGERGVRVLSARPAQAEPVLAYNSLADLLGTIDAAVLAALPVPQHRALDLVLLRADAGHSTTDRRAVGAGFLSVVEYLADQGPVLIAIDDMQWLDPSSRDVIAFVARRIAGPVGVLGTLRTEHEGGCDPSWLQLSTPAAMQRIMLHPLSIGALHAVLSARLGRSFSRPAMVRIHEISGGNPFYGLELARAMDGETMRLDSPLPPTLAELVRARISSVGDEARESLLAMACLATPTVELVAGVTDMTAEQLIAVLADAESTGIVTVEGHRLRFVHPLLARGVYTGATPGSRRTMHGRLAEVVEEPELHARHLALAATVGDPATLASLDAAAETARRRGAPAAAAELLDLAIDLGGETPERQIRSARAHFEAGSPARAGAMLEQTMELLPPGMLRAQAANLLAMVRMLNHNFLDAAALLETVFHEIGDNGALLVQTLIAMSFALVNAGKPYTAELRAEEAVVEAQRLGHLHLLSQALGMRVMLHFMRGDGLGEADILRACELEDPEADVSSAFSPGVQHALLLAWTGRLEEAHRAMRVVRRRFMDRGEEGELVFVDFHTVLIAIWRGDFAEAALVTENAVERAMQLNSDLPLFVALTVRATVGAYAGREDEVRRDVAEGLEAGQRCSSDRLAEWPVTALGFLEVSLGNYAAAVETLRPLLRVLASRPESTEIIGASFLPDIVESLIHLDRLDEALPCIELLERNGARLDRAWMLAVAARCRAMLLAAHGDLDAATGAARRAATEHDRLAMPFERARTQLLLGRLQRRQLHKDAASTTLHEALDVFERLNTPLWANRARAELDRVNVHPTRTSELTPSEHRVAELAASGLTNRAVAAALFISPKTVEANLARIYRKLAIHSRAELGHRMARPDG
ncbi:LuxR C-terminal-related transcriptional regulator [Mycobacterium sp. 21AC1]|uniref:AAA family ATPase n=1 Tax=[Mycobacterium] appelbergii TaxID=2939269 RepID=UPI002938DFE5|nr:AAA family ATPase [Mycobacterium sp. 21AC1]MDV3125777.1 LuxR C-terminal-related transcriptional regulator [Mycobacterium sp. 21AC1]